MQTETCPLCGSDLTGAPIPQEYIDKGYYPSGATHYSRMIGIYDTNLDRTVAWQCPDCGGQWQRGRTTEGAESDDIR